uniref:Zgc:195282 n=1 Tax=Salarias fasciatus TaxID=181472 RepID=A0A672GG52_SALFA
MVGYCPICGKPVYFAEKKRSLGRDYHPLCLKCQKCNRQLTAGQHAEVQTINKTGSSENVNYWVCVE